MRDRSALPPAARRIELVAPEEIALAIERAVGDALGMAAEAVPQAAGRLLGFPRVGDEVRARIEVVVTMMSESGRLVRQGTHLNVARDRDG